MSFHDETHNSLLPPLRRDRCPGRHRLAPDRPSAPAHRSGARFPSPLDRNAAAAPPASSPPHRFAPPSPLSQPRSSPSLPRRFGPEERTNILVYDKANRSVVHITTKSAQRELLILEVP